MIASSHINLVFVMIFFFLCGHIGPPSGKNAVGISFKKKKGTFLLKVKN